MDELDSELPWEEEENESVEVNAINDVEEAIDDEEAIIDDEEAIDENNNVKN